ncbi:hypothetical protein [Pseudomonas fluorescens]|uniref:Uncharacterized protein n=1 Tax=Pseudomonas fluorescens TaxID=294 RepID=A0A5E6Y294_PSEFL|nr:hypothetical protein [Pseudomonas fluorescens]VVN47573.1 hypothetical protein PS655_05985 [Pseudomonas fluorescens]
MAKNKPNQGARKTETLTLRLDPKVRLTIELISRVRRQSITGVVEAAIEDIAFDLDVPFVEDGAVKSAALGAVFSEIWSTDESELFINMCFRLPSLLTYEEQRLWETIKASVAFREKPTSTVLTDWEVDGVGRLDKAMLRMFWSDLAEHVVDNRESRTVVPFVPPY